MARGAVAARGGVSPGSASSRARGLPLLRDRSIGALISLTAGVRADASYSKKERVIYTYVHIERIRHRLVVVRYCCCSALLRDPPFIAARSSSGKYIKAEHLLEEYIERDSMCVYIYDDDKDILLFPH